jgi:hypothetical protein
MWTWIQRMELKEEKKGIDFSPIPSQFQRILLSRLIKTVVTADWDCIKDKVFVIIFSIFSIKLI